MEKILQGEKEKMSKLNLYIKCLTPYVAEQHLYQAFSNFGTVTGCGISSWLATTDNSDRSGLLSSLCPLFKGEDKDMDILHIMHSLKVVRNAIQWQHSWTFVFKYLFLHSNI